jgi:succinylglutamate desuccinylase
LAVQEFASFRLLVIAANQNWLESWHVWISSCSVHAKVLTNKASTTIEIFSELRQMF